MAILKTLAKWTAVLLSAFAIAVFGIGTIIALALMAISLQLADLGS
jgi:hypothetical protein